MPDERKDHQNQADNDQLEREALLREQERLSRKQAIKAAEEDEDYQRKQVARIQWWGALLKTISFRIGSLIKNSFKVAGHEIVKLSMAIPPVNAFVTGVFLMVDLAEAIFLSKEARDVRAVKAITATISTGFVIAAAVMLLHPLTFPLASVFSTLAMGVSTVRDGYYWYKSSQALAAKEEEFAEAKQNYESEKAEYDYAKIQYDRGELSPQLMDQHRKQLNSSIANCNAKSEEVSKKTAENSEKMRNFFFTGLSFIGMGLITLAGVAVAGFILANPVALGVVGLVVLAVATGLAIKNRIAPPQPESVEMVALVEKVDAEKPENAGKILDNTLDHQHAHKKENALEVSSEKNIVSELTDTREEAKEMLINDIKSLHEDYFSPPSSDTSKSGVPKVTLVNVTREEKKDEDSESEGVHFKKSN